jgi:aryl-alcohol dehydrogenase-like predicted oxidoreductase
MLTRPFGNSNIDISLIGYGCWKAGGAGWHDANDDATLDAIAAALASGITFFDTAPIYGMGHSEELLGKALKGRRDEVVVATKVGLVWDNQGRVTKSLEPTSVHREIDASLRRLATDRIDLIQIHWNDHQTPIEAVMEAFAQARDQGKVRYFGVCNLDLKTLTRARQVEELVSVQVLYNLIDRNASRYLTETLEYRTEQEIVPYCSEHKLGLIPYSPLAQGFLSDGFDWRNLPKDDVRRLNKMFADNVQRREELLDIARGQGLTLAQLAMLWLARQPVISSIIIGSTSARHVEENVRTLDRLRELPEVD